MKSFLEQKKCAGISLTWAGGSWGGRSNSLDQNLVIFSQSLLGQVALSLDLDLQRLGYIRYHPVDRSQHKENDVLGLRKYLFRLIITASWKSGDISQAPQLLQHAYLISRMVSRTISLVF